MTNREIAELLVISKRTADARVEHILAKLGFSSRSQIAALVSDDPPSAAELRADPRSRVRPLRLAPPRTAYGDPLQLP